MLKIAWDPIYSHPLPEGHRFPMLKYELIPAQLAYEGLITAENLFSPGLIEEHTICLTHSKCYWQRLQHLTLSEKEQRRIGFPLSAGLIERERRIAQGTIDGCLFSMQYGIAFNAAGGTHHAGLDWGEGFCMLNDQAIAANYLINKNICNSILIIDLDVHQGNGTAEIFAGESRVFTFSMHGANNFLFRKEVSDLDIALSDGTGDLQYIDILKSTLPGIIEKTHPDFIFYLAGVDVLATDKLGKMALSRDACLERDKFVLNLCKKYKIPVQVSMGGGYSSKITDIVEAHCNTYRAAVDIYF